MEQLYHCPVCGWLGLEEKLSIPYSTYEICGCCGIEFGYEVSDKEGAIYQRKQWLQNGAPWFDDDIKPADWSVERAEQQIQAFLRKKDGR